jgi:hypothetical protein
MASNEQAQDEFSMIAQMRVICAPVSYRHDRRCQAGGCAEAECHEDLVPACYVSTTCRAAAVG